MSGKDKLISVEHLKWNVGGIKCGTLTVDYLNWILDHEEPAVDAVPQWIPCSERLPEDNATVLITHRGGVSFGWYNGRYWERGANTKHRPLQTVTAWMPLPKPYEVKE